MGVKLPHLQSGQSPPEYAIDAQHVNVLKIDLSTARDRARINIGGSMLWVVDASDNFAECEFFFRENQSEGIPIRLGSKISGVKFSRSAISNAAQPGQWVKILYAADKGEFLGIENPWQNDNIVLGEAMGDNCFVGAATQTGITLGSIQLWNPATSSVMLHLSQLTFSVSSSTSAYFTRHNAALSTINAESSNRKFGGNTPLGELYKQDLAAIAGTVIQRYRAASYQTYVVPQDLIIPPGFGLILNAGAVTITGTFWWKETPYA